MRQHFLQPFPRWFTEGLAVFLQTTRLEAERAIVGEYSEAFAFLLTGGGWLSGEEVFGSTPRDFSRIENSQFYAQSWLAVSYLQTSSEGNARLERYLTAIRNGANVDAAFEPAFGVTISDFHSELRTYARGVFPTLAVPVTALPAQAIQTTRLPEAADDLLLLTLRMRRSPAEEEIADIATRVEAAAARHPTDPYALRARAQAALMQKNAAGARAILGTLLAASPQDHEALYLMGSSYVIEASLPDQADPAAIAQQGRRYFARAFRIAPNHYQTLYAYARTFPLPLETATLDVLVRAHLLAPQVSEISINTAQALMLAGRHTEAVPLLQAVVYAPHREASESLRALLAAAQRGEPPPSSSETEDNDDE
jgi:Flp pilus assembly protein TadD